MSTASLLRFSLAPHTSPLHRRHHLLLPFHYNRRRALLPPHSPKLQPFPRVYSKAVEFKSPRQLQQQDNSPQEDPNPTVLLDVSGMMCGACATRVKSILSGDERVDSVVVNMLTETAAIKLKEGVVNDFHAAADELAKRVSASGFDARRRVSGMGVEEKVRKWRETVEKKEALLVKSRNRVAFAWTLVALCCGAHASHVLHSLGIHVGHGENFDTAACNRSKNMRLCVLHYVFLINQCHPLLKGILNLFWFYTFPDVTAPFFRFFVPQLLLYQVEELFWKT